jgi:hypothetical protein
MNSFRIIAVPPGQAPLWVRQAWVGLVLPMDKPPSVPSIVPRIGAVTSTFVGGVTPTKFSVKFRTALPILRKANPEAANWWETESHPAFRLDPLALLIFAPEVCELLG